MNILARLLVTVGFTAAVVSAQDTAAPVSPERPLVPEVTINSHAVPIQQSIFPEYYRVHSVTDDIAWVTAGSREITTFFQEHADSLLRLLTTLSGIPWQEKQLELYLVRYLPSFGSSDPLILPVGGIRQGALVEAMPAGAPLKFNLMYHLADRMLSQSSRSATADTAITNHILMQYLPYRRELLTLLLTIETSRRLLGNDSTRAAYESPFWIRHINGRRIFEDYLLSKWSLSPEKPLVRWLVEQPVDSEFVALTGQIEVTTDENRKPHRQYIEGLPLKGQFGFSVKLNGANNLVVEKIDDSRLAYLCGLRSGDVIKQVNGKHPRTQKELMETIVSAFDVSSVMLQIARDGKAQTILLRPIHAGENADSASSQRDSL